MKAGRIDTWGTGLEDDVVRGSLSFELPLSFEQAAFRKANGQYVRKNQWRETNVTVYIDLD